MSPGNFTERVGFVPYAGEHEAIELQNVLPVDHFPELRELLLWLDLIDKERHWLQSRGLTWD